LFAIAIGQERGLPANLIQDAGDIAMETAAVDRHPFIINLVPDCNV